MLKKLEDALGGWSGAKVMHSVGFGVVQLTLLRCKAGIRVCVQKNPGEDLRNTNLITLLLVNEYNHIQLPSITTMRNYSFLINHLLPAPWRIVVEEYCDVKVPFIEGELDRKTLVTGGELITPEAGLVAQDWER